MSLATGLTFLAQSILLNHQVFSTPQLCGMLLRPGLMIVLRLSQVETVTYPEPMDMLDTQPGGM